MNAPAHIGSEIRTARQEHRWSQHYLASRTLMSQKQLSRIERGEPIFLARDTLIRLAATLETPIITGTVNQWLALCGYRPHLAPHLPLPPNYLAWLDAWTPFPVLIVDVGWFIVAANAPWMTLTGCDVSILHPHERHVLWQLLYGSGYLAPCLADLRRRVLARLAQRWAECPQEAWQSSLVDSWHKRALLTPAEDPRFAATTPALLPESLECFAAGTWERSHFWQITTPVALRPDLQLWVLWPTEWNHDLPRL